MSFEAKGAYAIVLDLIYMQGGALPDDARYISGLLNVSIRKWKSLRSELVADGKIQASGEFLTNYRAVSEIETLMKFQEKQSENASTPRKNKDLRKPRLGHTEPYTDILSNDNIHKVDFDAFWKLYPKRDGSNPRKPASQKFALAVKKGVDPKEIINGVDRYARHCDDRGITGTSYVAQAVTWLNQERWTDEYQQSKADEFAAKREAARKQLAALIESAGN